MTEMTRYLESNDALGATHAELESYVESEGRELLRRTLQAHYELRAERPVRVQGSDGVVRTHRRASARPVVSVVGRVEVD